jgi:hypothetical protein
MGLFADIFLLRPAIALFGIVIENQMKVIAHDGIGVYGNGKVL